jgi:hypothetical protein
VAAPWIGVQFLKGRYQSSPQWVQVDIAHQFLEIEIFLTQNRFVSILKKLTVPPVFLIEPTRVASQKAAHEHGYRNRSGSEQEMGVVFKKRPG